MKLATPEGVVKIAMQNTANFSSSQQREILTNSSTLI
jgi:hypothetical protein